MVKVDSTITTLLLAGAMAIAIGFLANWAATWRNGPNATPAVIAAAPQPVDTTTASAAAVKPHWATSATGRVEPKDGEVRVTAQAPGQIVEVAVSTNAEVRAGDLLVRLDDDDLISKVTAAQAEAAVREREREEEEVKGPALDRRRAEDAVTGSDRAVFAARQMLDAVTREMSSGSGSAEAVAKARGELATAEKSFAEFRAKLAKLNANPGMPLPTRLESALSIARTDLSLAESAVERARIRAPFDGTVLNVWAKVGETAAPTPDVALALMGDLSSLRVRAEVEERDVTKVRVGQRVVVKADAFPDKEFEGRVTSLNPSLGPPRILTRGPRRPNDVEVLEVLVALDGVPPLLTGMRVDVYFRLDTTARSEPGLNVN